jgi:hypothetical protein
MYPTMVIKNWNGMYTTDCFRIIKPIHEEHALGAVFELKDEQVNGVSLGYAKIVAVSKIYFKNINDSLAFSIINKPSPYLKTVLQKIYSFREEHIVHLINLQWTERNLEAHRAAMMVQWDKILKQAPTAQYSLFKDVNF